METTCAVCRLNDDLVVNIIIANPSDTAPDECQLVEVMTGQPCNIGWYWDGQTFVDPFPPMPDTEA